MLDYITQLKQQTMLRKMVDAHKRAGRSDSETESLVWAQCRSWASREEVSDEIYSWNHRNRKVIRIEM